MRKAGIAVLTIVLAGLGAGLWLGMRRQPAGALLEEPAAAFTLEAAAPGQLARFVATQIALRALRWLPPRQDGVLVVQAQTQSDRQLLALFRAGAAPVEIPVARPQGVGEGFWRFAVLQDALVGPDGILLLLFRPGDPGSAESSLAMALDPGALEARWVHRGAYDRMALGGEPDPAVFLFGGKGPVQRLALGGTVRRPAAKDIELPAEVPEVEDLLPTGAGSFLVASRNGLSAFQGAKGWSHFPPPAEQGVPCANARGVLTRAGKRIWWQPAPGLLVQVGPDGATVADREVPFPAEDPQARDARLLKLLGPAIQSIRLDGHGFRALQLVLAGLQVLFRRELVPRLRFREAGFLFPLGNLLFPCCQCLLLGRQLRFLLVDGFPSFVQTFFVRCELRLTLGVRRFFLRLCLGLLIFFRGFGWFIFRRRWCVRL